LRWVETHLKLVGSLIGTFVNQLRRWVHGDAPGILRWNQCHQQISSYGRIFL